MKSVMHNVINQFVGFAYMINISKQKRLRKDSVYIYNIINKNYDLIPWTSLQTGLDLSLAPGRKRTKLIRAY